MKKLQSILLEKCPFCEGYIRTKYYGLSDRLRTVPGRYDIAECISCGVVFTNPLPKKNLEVLYPKNYLIPNRRDRKNLYTFYRNDQYFFDIKLIHQATGMSASLMEGVLDVGCGSGERVAFLTDLGVRRSMGIDKFDNMHGTKKTNIINSDILNYVPKKKYQLVTLFHVLEHLDNPKKQLSHIRKYYLKEDGYLVIQVPNYDSFERKIFGNRWFSFDVPRHLWHFNESSLISLLKKCDLKIVATYKKNALLHPVTVAPSICKEADPQRIWQVSTKNNNIKLLVWVLLTIITIPFSYLQSQFNQGSMLTMIAKKV